MTRHVEWREKLSVVSGLRFTIGQLVRTEAQQTETRSSMLATRGRAPDTHTRGGFGSNFTDKRRDSPWQRHLVTSRCDSLTLAMCSAYLDPQVRVHTCEREREGERNVLLKNWKKKTSLATPPPPLSSYYNGSTFFFSFKESGIWRRSSCCHESSWDQYQWHEGTLVALT